MQLRGISAREGRWWVAIVGLCAAALAFPASTVAQNYAKATSPDGWPEPVWAQPTITDQNRKPAPRRDLTGMWAPAAGHMGGAQAGGVLAKPNNGRPENQLSYTPYGLEQYRAHKAAEGVDAVLPAENNDPRNRCEPLGVPRYNHYNVRLTQIFQDETKVVILYHYDNRWRVIWTGRTEAPQAAGRWGGNRRPVSRAADLWLFRRHAGPTTTRCRSRRLEPWRRIGCGSIRRVVPSAIRRASPRHSGV